MKSRPSRFARAKQKSEWMSWVKGVALGTMATKEGEGEDGCRRYGSRALKSRVFWWQVAHGNRSGPAIEESVVMEGEVEKRRESVGINVSIRAFRPYRPSTNDICTATKIGFKMRFGAFLPKFPPSLHNSFLPSPWRLLPNHRQEPASACSLAHTRSATVAVTVTVPSPRTCPATRAKRLHQSTRSCHPHQSRPCLPLPLSRAVFLPYRMITHRHTHLQQPVHAIRSSFQNCWLESATLFHSGDTLVPI